MGDYQEEILLLNDLARKIRDKRFANGAVNFESVEVKFKLDEKGKPLEVIPKERKEAHKMIEEEKETTRGWSSFCISSSQ